MKKKPPKIPQWLLEAFVRSTEKEFLLGDFDEFYNEKYIESGFLSANLWYCLQVLKSIWLLLGNLIIRRITMFNSYLKLAIRNLAKYKAFSIINIFGFSIGIAACITIYISADYIFSFDEFHENIDDIYYIYREQHFPNGTRVTDRTQIMLLPEILETYPDIDSGTRVYNIYPVVMNGEKQFNEELSFIDDEFFDIFSFKLSKGSIQDFRTIKNSVILTEKTAEKYFGEDDPLGKILTVDYTKDYTVIGVLENIPSNSTIDFDLLAPFENAFDIERVNKWNHFRSCFISTYLYDKDMSSIESLERNLYAISVKHRGEEDAKTDVFKIMPFEQMNDFETGMDTYANSFVAVALIILLIAVMNFVNLSTGRLIERSKELGMRKVLGAVRKQVITQILQESVIISVISLVIGTSLAKMALPYINEYSGLETVFPQIFSVLNLAILTVFGLVIGLAAGIIPAIMFSKNRPIEALKSHSCHNTRGMIMRNGMILIQFSICVLLIFGSIVIRDQLNFIREADLGFDKENILAFRIDSEDFESPEQAVSRIRTFKEELKRNSSIINVSYSLNVPGVNNTLFRTNARPKGWGPNEDPNVLLLAADENYFETYGIEIKEGRNFSKNSALDMQNNTIIINSTFYNLIGQPDLQEAIVRIGGRELYVAGVVEDYHFKSLKEEISSLVFYYDSFNYVRPNHISVRYREGDQSNVLGILNQEWEKLAPGKELDYFFVEEKINTLYKNEEKIGVITSGFSVFAIMLAGLGLYGLFNFSVLRKTKEIGIRKVLGASNTHVIFNLAGRYIYLIILSNVLAIPGAYYLMNLWLDTFAYRITPGIKVLSMTLLISVIIAASTIIYRTLKAAHANPAESLKYE